MKEILDLKKSKRACELRMGGNFGPYQYIYSEEELEEAFENIKREKRKNLESNLKINRKRRWWLLFIV